MTRKKNGNGKRGKKGEYMFLSVLCIWNGDLGCVEFRCEGGRMGNKWEANHPISNGDLDGAEAGWYKARITYTL